MNHEMTVKYILDDEEFHRLEKCSEVYNSKGYDTTPEMVFSMIMQMGSKYSIDNALKFAEKNCQGVPAKEKAV